MGQIEVKSDASRTVDYDLMTITMRFSARDEVLTEASRKVMQECEEFLGILKKCGADIHD